MASELCIEDIQKIKLLSKKDVKAIDNLIKSTLDTKGIKISSLELVDIEVAVDSEDKAALLIKIGLFRREFEDIKRSDELIGMLKEYGTFMHFYNTQKGSFLAVNLERLKRIAKLYKQWIIQHKLTGFWYIFIIILSIITAYLWFGQPSVKEQIKESYDTMYLEDSQGKYVSFLLLGSIGLIFGMLLFVIGKYKEMNNSSKELVSYLGIISMLFTPIIFILPFFLFACLMIYYLIVVIFIAHCLSYIVRLYYDVIIEGK